MTFDASDRKAIRRAEKDSAIADRQRGETIHALMQTTAGRTYIWAELAACHIFHTNFSLEALQMAFSEGERNAGLRLMDSVMEFAPDEFLLMWRENSARERTRQQPRSAGRDRDVDSTDDDGDETGNFFDDPRNDAYHAPRY